jgi:hypothetical protein
VIFDSTFNCAQETGRRRNSAPATRAIGRAVKPGNPGKPKGTRNRVTALAERLVEGQAEEIVRSIIASAKSGNPAAIAAVARILLPERRGRSVAIDLGGELQHTAESLARATTAILQSAVDGVISAEEDHSHLYHGRRKLLEAGYVEAD